MLSLKVQKDSITLSEYLESITVLHLSLIELKQLNLEELNTFLGEISGDIFRNVTLKNVTHLENYSEKLEEIINVLMEAIDKRFSPMENDPVQKAGETLCSLGSIQKVERIFSQECDLYNKI